MTHNTREEWESVTWNVLSSVQIGRMSLADAQDKLDAALHHQLQKAREEGWNEGARYVEQNMASAAKASEEHGYHKGFQDGGLPT